MLEENITGNEMNNHMIIYKGKEKLDDEGRFGVGSDVVEGDINDRCISEKNNRIKEHRWDEETKTGTIVLERDIRKLGSELFKGTAIEELYLPSTVEEIGDRCFMYCTDLKSIVLPRGLKKIGEYCFYDCIMLQEVDINDNIEEVGEKAFCGVRNVKYKGGKEGEWGERCRNGVWEEGVLYRNGKKEEVVCVKPDVEKVVIEGMVQRIEDFAFYSCKNLKEVVFQNPENIKHIGDHAFAHNHQLEHLPYFVNLKHVGCYAFYMCNNLKSFFIGPKVREVGENGFEGVINIHVVSKNKYLDGEEKWGSRCKNGVWEFSETESEGDVLYEDSSKQKVIYVDKTKRKVVIKDGVREIGDSCFSHSEVEQISLPNTITKIGDEAFLGCKNLKTIDLPSSVIHMGTYVFGLCVSLQHITFPPLMSTIPVGCCCNCESLIDVVLPPMVSRIHRFAFSDCMGLNRILLPQSLQVVDDHAFYNCIGLVEIRIPDGVYEMGKDSLEGIKNVVTRNEMMVDREIGIGGAGTLNGVWEIEIGDSPSECTRLSLYSSLKKKTLIGVNPNGIRNEVYRVDDGVEVIGRNAMRGNPYIKKVILPRSVKVIAEGAFRGCVNLREIEGGEGVEVIGEKAFHGCTLLEHFNHNVLKSVRRIEKEAFCGCKGLGTGYGEDDEDRKKLKVGKDVEEIGEGAFMGCSSLREVEIEGVLRVVERGVFSGCEWLKRVEMKGIKEIRSRAFYGCKDMEEVEMGNKVEILGSECFGNCLSLKTIPGFEGVSICGSGAFYNCISLKEVRLGKMEILRENTFRGCRSIETIDIEGHIKKMERNSMYGCRGEMKIGGKDEIEFEGEWESVPCIVSRE